MGPSVKLFGPNLNRDSKCDTATLPKIVGVSYNLYDSLCIRYGHISPIYHDQKQIISIDHDHDA